MEGSWIRPLRRLLVCLCLVTAAATAAPAEPVETTTSPQVGEFPPPELGRNRDKQMVNLEQRRGKVVVMTFWATWCGPCRHELPMLAQMQKIVGHDALQVIAVNMGEPRADVLAFARANRDLDLEYVFDPKGETAQRYGIRAIPHMFVIDHDGRIAAIHHGYGEKALPGILQDVLDLLPEDVKTRPAGAPPAG